jgi:ATP-dependent Clp protease ATP-binding subunit ClpA
MFERFTTAARRAVVEAQAEARRLQHGYIGTEHLLLGLLAAPETGAGRVLHALGIESEAVRAELVEILGMGGTGAPAEPDANALDAIGIDLDAVRRRVEEAFGPGALDRALSSQPCGRRRWGGRRQRRTGVLGHIPFTPRAKKVLELSLREALRLGHNYIGSEHILLGLLREGQGLAAQILVRRGLEIESIRAQVLEELTKNQNGPRR